MESKNDFEVIVNDIGVALITQLRMCVTSKKTIYNIVAFT